MAFEATCNLASATCDCALARLETEVASVFHGTQIEVALGHRSVRVGWVMGEIGQSNVSLMRMMDQQNSHKPAMPSSRVER